MTFVPGQDQPSPETPEPPTQVPLHSPAPLPEQQVPLQPPAGVPVQQPVWAAPAPVLQWRQTPPLEYHQLYRGTARYRWWKPLLTVVLGVFYYFTLSTMFTVPIIFLYGASTDGGFSPDMVFDLAVPDTQNPWSMFAGFGSIVLMIPAVWLAMLSTGLRPAARSWSVALRIRWNWIWRTLPMALLAVFVMNVVGIGLSMATNPGLLDEPADTTLPELDMRLAAISLVIGFLLIPLQATAEEVVFRGVFMQTLGAWLGGVRGGGGVARFVRGPWLPILVPSIIFGFAHIYDIWGFAVVTTMAIAFGWITWRTGGLEAAISLHIVNNLMGLIAMAFAVGGETGQTADSGGNGGASVVGYLVAMVLYCFIVDRSFQKRDARRTRIDYVQVAA